MNNKNKYFITIITGTIIMLAGIMLLLFDIASDRIASSGIITAGMIMVLIGFVKLVKIKKGKVKDELTRKIANKAAAYSWTISLLVLLGIFWINHFEIVQFSVNSIIIIMYVTMVGTMLLYQQLFWKRGIV